MNGGDVALSGLMCALSKPDGDSDSAVTIASLSFSHTICKLGAQQHFPPVCAMGISCVNTKEQHGGGSTQLPSPAEKHSGRKEKETRRTEARAEREEMSSLSRLDQGTSCSD